MSNLPLPSSATAACQVSGVEAGLVLLHSYPTLLSPPEGTGPGRAGLVRTHVWQPLSAVTFAGRSRCRSYNADHSSPLPRYSMSSPRCTCSPLRVSSSLQGSPLAPDLKRLQEGLFLPGSIAGPWGSLIHAMSRGEWSILTSHMQELLTDEHQRISPAFPWPPDFLEGRRQASSSWASKTQGIYLKFSEGSHWALPASN